MLKAWLYVSIGFVVFGSLLNLLVICANGWHMPIEDGTLGGTAGFFGLAWFGTVKSCPLTEVTALPFLADIYPLPGTDHKFSMGDAFAMVGFLGTALSAVAILWRNAVAKDALKLVQDGPSPRKLHL